MKPTKTFKSLAELTADSIVVIEAEPDKPKASQAQVFTEALQRIRPENLTRVQTVPSYRDWGINE
jgi:hypothetical protein